VKTGNRQTEFERPRDPETEVQKNKNKLVNANVAQIVKKKTLPDFISRGARYESVNYGISNC